MQTALPTDISAATDEEIAATEAALVAEFDAAIDAGSTDVALLTEIAEAIEAVRTEGTARKVAAAEAAEAVAALAERVRATADPEDADEDIDDAEAVVEIVEPQAEAAPAAEETTTAEAAEAEADTEERELVTASADKTPKAPSARAVARRSPQADVPAPQPEVVITAAADVPGYAGGATIDRLGIAKAMHAKARTLSNGSGYVPVASIALPIEHKLGADLSHNLDVLDKVTSPESLTAAGWCAPSNNLYEMFGIEAADGLLDLPTVQITRGGLNVPAFIGYDEAVANGGLWTWDEDAADDGYSTKPCVTIPCPTFTDYRLEAEGICVTNGNLTDRAFPELTRRYVDLVVNTHLHRVSASMVNKIVSTATPVSVSYYPTSASGAILRAIDLQVADYRSQYRMSVNSVLEAVFPLWVKEVLRADFAMRDASGYSNVTDEMIDAHFAARKVRAQFVHDYQPAFGNFPSGSPYGGPAVDFVGSISFLMYPAGGYVKGDGGTIDLGVVRDSVLNATNDYTAAWTEQLFLVAQVGPAAREITVNFAVDGVTACCPAV